MQDSSPFARLMVIIPDRLSDLAAKGEITERYYNPGNLFGEVHLVLVNDDQPDPAIIQKMVGDARLVLHNLPPPPGLFLRSLGWQPLLLSAFARPVVELARELGPSLIRCHGPYLNGVLARKIKAQLGIPYVVSMHINPDEDIRGRASDWRNRLRAARLGAIERYCLLEADLVMPVYRTILPYLTRIGVERRKVHYNVLNPTHLRSKASYDLHQPVKVASVGRQFAEKNPDNLIRAVAAIDGVELTLIGDGPSHAYLRQVAAECRAPERIKFLPSVPNDELCRSLAEYDLFAVHTEYWEISKAVLEALLSGLPVIINRRHGEPTPELTPDICRYVENSVESYGQALADLINNHTEREALGRRAYAHAQTHWSPTATEAAYAETYRSIVMARTQAGGAR